MPLFAQSDAFAASCYKGLLSVTLKEADQLPRESFAEALASGFTGNSRPKNNLCVYNLAPPVWRGGVRGFRPLASELPARQGPGSGRLSCSRWWRATTPRLRSRPAACGASRGPLTLRSRRPPRSHGFPSLSSQVVTPQNHRAVTVRCDHKPREAWGVPSLMCKYAKGLL